MLYIWTKQLSLCNSVIVIYLNFCHKKSSSKKIKYFRFS